MKRTVLVLFVLALLALAAVVAADPGMTWQDIWPGTIAHVHCEEGVATPFDSGDNTVGVYCDTGPALVSPPVTLERMR